MSDSVPVAHALDALEAEMPEWRVTLADTRHPEQPRWHVTVRANSRFGAYAAALLGQPVHIVADDHPLRI
jgi:hypothetical protein